jgi:hypothetical protein
MTMLTFCFGFYIALLLIAPILGHFVSPIGKGPGERPGTINDVFIIVLILGSGVLLAALLRVMGWI